MALITFIFLLDRTFKVNGQIIDELLQARRFFKFLSYALSVNARPYLLKKFLEDTILVVLLIIIMSPISNDSVI